MRVDSSLVPCAVFAFNRPEKLKRVLAALRTQDIDHLIVFVDGPRDGADVGLVQQCRNIAREVDWVEKELHFREHNYGLPGLIDNISTVLGMYDVAVFVEDDCLPMPAFYSFVRRALTRYEAEERVFSIGGYQPVPYTYFRDYPYSLVSCARFTCWGWATWQDRWEEIRPYLSRWRELFDGLENVPDVAGRDIGPMARRHAQARSPSWDVQVAISALWLEKLHLLPTKGLVRNIGLGGGTHGGAPARAQRRKNRNICRHSLHDIVWLKDVGLDKDYAERLKYRQQRPDRPVWERLWSRVRARVQQRIPSHIKKSLREIMTS